MDLSQPGHVVIVPFHVNDGYEREPGKKIPDLPAEERAHLLDLHGWRPEDLEDARKRAERYYELIDQGASFERTLEFEPRIPVAHTREHDDGRRLHVPHLHVDDQELEDLERLPAALGHLSGGEFMHPFDEAYGVLKMIAESLRVARAGDAAAVRASKPS